MSKETKIRKIIYYLCVYMGNQMAPREQGTSDAYKINSGPFPLIRDHLERARRSRRSILSWVSPWRRQYLDGLIACLENELVRRDRDPV